MKDLKKILAAYKENVSGGEADLVLRVYAIFSRVTSHSAAISDVSTSSVDDTLVNSFTYDAIFRSSCSKLSWTTDLRSTPPFTFIQQREDLNHYNIYQVLQRYLHSLHN